MPFRSERGSFVIPVEGIEFMLLIAVHVTIAEKARPCPLPVHSVVAEPSKPHF